jgi:AcrR family transcriptional regulator
MVSRAASAEATGQRILDAAEGLFAHLLYDQVSLQAVADRAGVTVQTILRRFGSKDGLFAAVADRRSERIGRARDGAPVGDAAGVVRALVGVYEIWGDAVLILLAQEARAETIRTVTERGRRRHRAWVERDFAPWLGALPPPMRRRRLAQLVAATDLATWKILRRDLGLGREEAEAAMCDLVARLLA